MIKKRLLIITVLTLFIFQSVSVTEFLGIRNNQSIVYASSDWTTENFIEIIRPIRSANVQEISGSLWTEGAVVGRNGGDNNWKLIGDFNYYDLPKELQQLAKMNELLFELKVDIYTDTNDSTNIYVVEMDDESHETDISRDTGIKNKGTYKFSTGQERFKRSVQNYELEIWSKNRGNNCTKAGNFQLLFQDDGSPGVQYIEVCSDNDKYGIGDPVDIKFHFDEAVIVDTNGTIPMNTGTDAAATYESGNGTKDIIFRYVVKEDDLVRKDMTSNPLNKGDYLNVSGELKYHLGPIVKDISGNPLDQNNWKSAYNTSYEYDGTYSHFYNQIETKQVQIDGVPPLITNIDIDIQDGYQYMKQGDILTITLTTDDVVYGTNGYINFNSGNKAIYKSGSGSRTITYEYIVQDGDNGNKLAYNDFVDNLGIYDDFGNAVEMPKNIGVKALAYQEKEIYVDTTKPTIRFSPDGNSIYTKSQKTIMNVIETGSGIKGDLIKYIWNNSRSYPKNWETDGEIAFDKSETSHGDTGDWYLHVFMEDNAGNISSNCTSKVFKLDNQKPEINISTNGIEKYLGQEKVTTNVTVTDSHSGVDGATVEYQWQYQDEKIGDFNWKLFTNNNNVPIPDFPRHGEYTLHIRAEDVLGNKEQVQSNLFYLDKKPPIITIDEDENMNLKRKHVVMISAIDKHSKMGKMAYYWSNSAVSLTSSDPKWVNIDYKVNKDGENEFIYLADSTEWTEKMDGLWHLHVLAQDEWGNESFSNMPFKVDTVPPEVEFTYPVALTSVVKEGEAKVEATDYNGIESLFYQWTENETPPSIDDTNWVSLGNGDTIKKSNVNGDWYLHIKAKDGFKNEGIVTSRKITIDNDIPETGNFYITSNKYINTSNVAVEIKTEEYEKVKYHIKDIDNVEVKTGTMTTDTVNILLAIPSIEGKYKYYFSFEDELGNISPSIEKTFIYDTTSPEAELQYSELVATNSDVTVKLSNISDNYTKLEDVVTPKGNKHVFNENGSYTFEIMDQAGNEKNIVANVNWIDKVAPNIEIIPLEAEKELEEGKETGQNKSIRPLTIASKELRAKVNVTDNISNNEDIQVYYRWSQNNKLPVSEDAGWINIGGNTTIKNSNVEDGDWYLHIKAIDGVGNENIVSSSGFVSDNSAPTANITYSTPEATANAVIAKITFDEPGVKILKPENGLNFYEFTENGSYTFEFEDIVGNKGAAVATVNNIETELIKADIFLSTKEWTKDNVEITISSPENYYLDEFIFTDGMGQVLKSSNKESEESENIIQAVYEVESNGIITFVLKDNDENTADQPVTIEINNIDKDNPQGTIQYSTSEWTKGPVIAKLVIDELSPVTIINNNGSNKFEFTENGEFEFIFRDATGNESKAKAVVSNIDKEKPTATSIYSETKRTNEQVTVTITPEDNSGEEVTILNNGGSNSYVFVENGSFTFRLRDKAGNESDYNVKVENIDTEKPKAYITYNITEDTKEDVIAAINFTDIMLEPVTITNNEGKNEYFFTKNGTFKYEFVDAAGNKGDIIATVDWIDKTVPEGIVSPSETKPTRKNVLLTLITEEGTIISNNKGKNTILAKENGIYTFSISDKVGNSKDITYEVTNIDREKPVGKIYYNTEKLTNTDVIATVSANESIKVINNNGGRDYIFERNGKFTFEIEDEAGNRSSVEAIVDQIDKIPPVISVTYSNQESTNQPVEVTIRGNEPIVILNNEGESTFLFTKNGYFGFVVEDLAGNRVRANVQVKNMDFVAPTIEFGTKHLICLPGESLDFNDYIAYDDKNGLMTEKVIVDVTGVDMSKAGTYYAIYKVTDTAGNLTEIRRKIQVLSPNDLFVFVNGEIAPTDQYMIDASKVELKVFNAVEGYEVKYKSGDSILKKGDLKIGYELIDTSENSQELYFECDEIGWYTFYIQDLNRRTKKANIFFLRSK